MENMGRAGVGETITRAQLTEAVYQEVGLSRNESADLVESVLAEMSDALVRGEMVKLSSFGSFQVRQKGQRMGRNPKTGEEVPILPRRVLVFRPSHVLKKRINDGDSDVSGYASDTTSEPETAY
jgi:integration host factor subunit alpha